MPGPTFSSRPSATNRSGVNRWCPTRSQRMAILHAALGASTHRVIRTSDQLSRTWAISGTSQTYVHTFISGLKKMHSIHVDVHRQFHPFSQLTTRFHPGNEVIVHHAGQMEIHLVSQRLDHRHRQIKHVVGPAKSAIV